MPAAPAGSLLDISWVGYMNQGTGGTGSTVLFATVNGVQQNPQTIVGDRVQLESYGGHIVGISQPVGVAYNIVLLGQKLSAGGAIQCQPTHTTLNIVSYRP
jgi:hypothetical protein